MDKAEAIFVLLANGVVIVFFVLLLIDRRKRNKRDEEFHDQCMRNLRIYSGETPVVKSPIGLVKNEKETIN